MKNFIKFVERLHKENYVALHARLVEEKIPCAVVSASSEEDTKKFIDRLRAEGLNIDRLIFATSSAPNFFQSDIEIDLLRDFSKLRPRPQFIFVDTELDYKFAATIDAPDLTIIKPPLKLSTTQKAVDVCMSNISKLYELYSQLIDEESRRVLCGYWLARVTRKFGEIVQASTPHYICSGFAPKPDDIVIQAGACDGNTAAWFADMGCKVYAFEMDRQNYELAVPLAQKKNFVLENLGLGAFNHEEHYTHYDFIAASAFDVSGTFTTQVVSLDSYVLEHKIPRIDFITLDVEGAEEDVLRGAACSIARWKPALAISAYHKLDDFWKLTELIKSICPNYELAMRHYVNTSESEPILFDDRTLKMFKAHELEASMISIAECVLLAR